MGIKSLNNMIELYLKHNDTVMTVEHILNPRYGQIINNEYVPSNYNFYDRGQDIEDLYRENGNIYILNSKTILNNKMYENKVYSYLINLPETIDIDYEHDLMLADCLLKTSNIKSIKINNEYTIGLDEKCFIIAEACDNHCGSLENAYKMIDIAVPANVKGLTLDKL